MSFKNISSILAGAFLAGCLAASATAAPITVSNHSFETPVLDAGGWSNVNLDWGDDLEASTDEFTEHIAGFSADGVNHTGIQNMSSLAQDLGVSLLPNTVYTLTVAVGNRNTNFTLPGNESRYGLYVGGNPTGDGALLAEDIVDATTIGEGTFQDSTLVFTSGEVPAAGNLWISLAVTSTGRAHFDNIRLDASPVPEPATFGLLAIGLAAVWGCSRRWRRA